jgi:hypothetical protein
LASLLFGRAMAEVVSRRPLFVLFEVWTEILNII